MQELMSDPYSLFIYAMKSPATREKYVPRLRTFFDFLGLTGTMEEKCKAFADKGTDDVNWVTAGVLRFLQMQRQRVERGEIAAATVRNYVKTIKLFCVMTEIALPWPKITRGLPKARRYANDRAPTYDEIRKITEYPDRRIKALVCTMSSSGIRLGSWDYLKWGHIKPIERDGKIIAARLDVYAGDPEQYFSFITPEAYRQLEGWMNYRREAGENITRDSWIMRNLWDTNRGARQGFITAPKKLKSSGVKRLMEDALWTQGLRKKLEEGKRRHEFQADHGFRKWFKTRCEIAGMKPINIEILMGHSTGISDSYYRATESELVEDYLKAVDALTIEPTQKLKKEVERLRNAAYDLEKMRKLVESRDSEMTDVKFQLKIIMSKVAKLDERDRNQIASQLVSEGVYRPVQD